MFIHLHMHNKKLNTVFSADKLLIVR